MFGLLQQLKKHWKASSPQATPYLHIGPVILAILWMFLLGKTPRRTADNSVSSRSVAAPYSKDCDDEICISSEICDDPFSRDGSGARDGNRLLRSLFYSSLDTWGVRILIDLRMTLERLISLARRKAEDSDICHRPLTPRTTKLVAPHGLAAPISTRRLSPQIMRTSLTRLPVPSSSDRYSATQLYGMESQSPHDRRSHPHTMQRLSVHIRRSLG